MEFRPVVGRLEIEVRFFIRVGYGRKYRLDCQSNKTGRILLSAVQGIESKRFCITFLEGKGLQGGWKLLVEKL